MTPGDAPRGPANSARDALRSEIRLNSSRSGRQPWRAIQSEEGVPNGIRNYVPSRFRTPSSAVSAGPSFRSPTADPHRLWIVYSCCEF